MANFITAYKLTAGNEGGYVNDSDDKGGETYCGITRKNFPKWAGWVIVDEYPMHTGDILHSLDDLVITFYKTNFWDKIGGDDFEDQDLANQVYDSSINIGIEETLKLFKQS